MKTIYAATCNQKCTDRNLPTPKPLVGLEKTTTPGLITTNYTYDQFNRLDTVHDGENNQLITYTNFFAALNSNGLIDLPKAPINFGVVDPNTLEYKHIKIENKDNKTLLIDDFTRPPYFSSPWKEKKITIPPGAIFNLPIIFNSPSNPIGLVSGAIQFKAIPLSFHRSQGFGDFEKKGRGSIYYEISYSFSTVGIEIHVNSPRILDIQ